MRSLDNIELWNYVFENCECDYIGSHRAYSAFITLAGYDYNEFELDKHRAKVKLADRVSVNADVLNWFKSKA